MEFEEEGQKVLAEAADGRNGGLGVGGEGQLGRA